MLGNTRLFLHALQAKAMWVSRTHGSGRCRHGATTRLFAFPYTKRIHVIINPKCVHHCCLQVLPAHSSRLARKLQQTPHAYRASIV